jgi:pimeloyl-ACP methyl ester carboxylesterase
VLLHGLTCHLGYWLRVVPLLEGVRVVAVDFRGHGLSPHADVYGYADYERDLLSLLERLELDRPTIAGHSLGGYVALLAASRSDRIGGVVAIDVKSDLTDDDAAFAARSRDGSQRVEPEREVLTGRLVKSLVPSVLGLDELELVAERSIEHVEGGWRFRWDRRVLATEPVDPSAFLPDVRCPALVLAGSLSEEGYVPVTPGTLETRFPGVYAIGDVATIGVPKAGVFAEGAARVVAASLIAGFGRGEKPDSYDGRGSCYVEFGAGLVGRVDVDFLSGPKPTGTFQEPSDALVAEKHHFGSSRTARWFGHS